MDPTNSKCGVNFIFIYYFCISILILIFLFILLPQDSYSSSTELPEIYIKMQNTYKEITNFYCQGKILQIITNKEEILKSVLYFKIYFTKTNKVKYHYKIYNPEKSYIMINFSDGDKYYTYRSNDEQYFIENSFIKSIVYLADAPPMIGQLNFLMNDFPPIKKDENIIKIITSNNDKLSNNDFYKIEFTNADGLIKTFWIDKNKYTVKKCDASYTSLKHVLKRKKQWFENNDLIFPEFDGDLAMQYIEEVDYVDLDNKDYEWYFQKPTEKSSKFFKWDSEK